MWIETFRLQTASLPRAMRSIKYGLYLLNAVFLSCDWMEFHGASAGKLTHVGI